VIKGEHSLDLGEVIKDFYGNENFVILLIFLLLPEGNEIVIYSPLKSLTIKPENFEVTQNYLEVNLEDIKKAILELTKWLIFEQEWNIDPKQIKSNLLESIRRILYTLLVRLEDITIINDLQRKIEITNVSKNNLIKLGLEINPKIKGISLLYIRNQLFKKITLI